jgi:4'-phosphopantetheinyl transferase EntD
MRLGGDPYQGRLLFAAKEAVYKAIAAREGLLLDYQDIEVDLIAKQARLRDGRTLDLRWVVSSYVVVLATMPEAPERFQAKWEPVRRPETRQRI